MHYKRSRRTTNLLYRQSQEESWFSVNPTNVFESFLRHLNNTLVEDDYNFNESKATVKLQTPIKMYK